MRLPFLFAFVLKVCSAQTQCDGNLIFNGDLNGVEGEAMAATGWTLATNTPDLNDENGPLNTTPGYIWTGVPLPSPTGGTWQSMTLVEAFSQDVATMPGATYSLCFDYAMQPVTFTGVGKVFDHPCGMAVFVDGELAYESPLATEPYLWEHACMSFVAAGELSALLFALDGDGTSTQTLTYGGIDGICMLLDPNTSATEQPYEQMGYFPNPAVDHIQVTGNGLLLRATAIFPTGQTVPLGVTGCRIELGTLVPGIYTVQCWFAGSTAPVCERVLVQGAQ